MREVRKLVLHLLCKGNTVQPLTTTTGECHSALHPAPEHMLTAFTSLQKGCYLETTEVCTHRHTDAQTQPNNRALYGHLSAVFVGIPKSPVRSRRLRSSIFRCTIVDQNEHLSHNGQQ